MKKMLCPTKRDKLPSNLGTERNIDQPPGKSQHGERLLAVKSEFASGYQALRILGSRLPTCLALKPVICLLTGFSWGLLAT